MLARVALSAWMTLAALAGGCGYSLSGNLPGHIKTVAVPVFKNKTEVPAVENTITAAVINAFVSSGRLKVVALDQADSVLEGEIVGYSIDAISFNPSINVQEYRLRVVVNIQFRDVRQNSMLWRQDGLQQQSEFQVAGQVSDTISRQDAASRDAAVDIGRKIVALAVDRF